MHLLPVRNIPVVIFAEPESFGSTAMSFIEKNIQWIISALRIPIFIAWFSARMRHKFESRNSFSNTNNDKQPESPAEKENNTASIVKPADGNAGAE